MIAAKRSPVIDVDGHTFEPDELWERVPARPIPRPPAPPRARRARHHALPARRAHDPAGHRAAARGCPRACARPRCTARAPSIPKLRLADMDVEGIDVAVLYGACSLGFYAIDDRELCNAVLPGLQRLAGRLLRGRPGRLKGTPALPLAWIDDACAEAERVRAGARLRVAHRAVRGRRAQRGRPRELPALRARRGARRADRLPRRRRAVRLQPVRRHVRAAARARVPVQHHVRRDDRRCAAACSSASRGCACALLEAGVGWAPYYLERLDEHWEHRPHEIPQHHQGAERVPGRRPHVRLDRGRGGLAHAIERSATDWSCGRRDYPHWDCDFPDSVTDVVERDDLTADQRSRIFSTNAKRLFGW